MDGPGLAVELRPVRRGTSRPRSITRGARGERHTIQGRQGFPDPPTDHGRRRCEQCIDGLVAAVLEQLQTLGQAANRNEDLETLERSFDEMPTDYREVLVASHPFGPSRAEIAAETGRTMLVIDGGDTGSRHDHSEAFAGRPPRPPVLRFR